MRIFKFMLLAGIVPAMLCAGSLTLPIGTSSAQIVFTPGPNTISLGNPVGCNNGCTISGNGTVGSTAFTWNLDTELIGNALPTYSGLNPFAINQHSAVVSFSLTDTSLDNIDGNLTLNTLTNSAVSLQGGTNGVTAGDTTDLNATITFTQMSLVSSDLINAINNVFGSAPGIGTTAKFDLVMSCGPTTPCVVVGNAQDPGTVGNLVGTISPSGAPEPGSIALLGSGLAALMIRYRRRK